MAPILGAIADRGGLKKRFLFFFTFFGALFTVLLYFVHAGDWLFALTVFILAGIGFSGANVFYGSMRVDVTVDRPWYEFSRIFMHAFVGIKR